MKSLLFSSKTSSLIFISVVLFFCTSCEHKVINITNTDQAIIQKYLDENVLSPAFGGKIFSAYKILQTEDHKIFLWVYFQEYYRKNGELEMGTGWSVPMVLITKSISGQLIISEHSTPRNGAFYSEDIKKDFPTEIQQIIFDFPDSKEMRELETYSRRRSELK